MKNIPQKIEKKQLNLHFGNPPKVFQTIHCHNCHNERELGGFVFRLVGVCDECRIESEVQTTGKRFERRRASK